MNVSPKEAVLLIMVPAVQVRSKVIIETRLELVLKVQIESKTMPKFRLELDTEVQASMRVVAEVQAGMRIVVEVQEGVEVVVKVLAVEPVVKVQTGVVGVGVELVEVWVNAEHAIEVQADVEFVQADV